MLYRKLDNIINGSENIDIQDVLKYGKGNIVLWG